MSSNKVADCFVLIQNNEIISPVLITIRSYGAWFEKTFDKYTSQMELYMKSKTEDGSPVLQYHPGTKIGKWFDTNNFNKDSLKSWYILKESYMMDRLVNLKLAEYKDAVPIAVNDKEKRQMIRVYTKDQIDLYLKTLTKDNDMEINVSVPKEVRVKLSELSKITKPDFSKTKKSLF